MVCDLLGDHGTDVGLEHAGSDAHDDDGDGKESDSRVRLGNDGRGGRSDEKNVADHGNENGPANGVEPPQVSVGDVGAEQRHRVGPELVRIEGSVAIPRRKKRDMLTWLKVVRPVEAC